MTQQPQEIELKFLCAPDDLGLILAAAPAGPDDTRELISVYFDTPDGRLQRAGASLRVRESKGQRVQTLKLGDGMSREEHEAPIATDAPDPSLGPLPELLSARARQDLKPAFHVRVTRRQRRVQFEGSEIELALDLGEVRGGAQTSPISEVELELKSGAPAALFGLARQLGQAAPLYLSFASKSQRGQALIASADAPKRPPLDRRARVSDAFQAIAHTALAAIGEAGESLRTRADAKAVHRLRVAARTFRSALSTFGEAVQDDRTDHVRGELRWLAKACDRARNLDVFAEETLAGANELPSAPHGLTALTAALDAAREEAHRQIGDLAASPRFRNLLIEAAAWSDTGAWIAGEAAAGSARAFAVHALRHRRKKLLKMGKGGLAKLDNAHRHAVRIQAKKLRYAAEGFQDLFDRKAARAFIARAKALQDQLGVLNDLATAEILMAELSLSADAALAAGELIGLKAAGKDDGVAEADRTFRKIQRSTAFWD